MEYKLKRRYRYKKYDYSLDGFYFVTICTKEKRHYFGKIINGKMIRSEIGKIAGKYWQEIPQHFDHVELNIHQIMPNHIHGIIRILGICQNPTSSTGQCPVPTVSKFGHVKPKSISTIIGSFKSIVTKTINQKSPNISFAWQSRFYDRIIRNEDEFNRIYQYIINNPLNWEKDRNNPENLDI